MGRRGAGQNVPALIPQTHPERRSRGEQVARQGALSEAQCTIMLSARRGISYHGAMPNYRRLFIPGGTFFFTVNLLTGARSC